MEPGEPNSGPLRIVLLGLPRAGKTALLAALGQLRQEQPALLKGELVDTGGGLEQRRQQFYHAIPESTAEAEVDYPVRFRPAARRARPVEAVLIDGTGQALLELFKQRHGASETAVTLPNMMHGADALVLAVDAAMKLETADKVWTEMGRLLRDVEHDRSRRLDVAGLPVFVVLTRCDRLAHDTDGNFEWMERIEERKRQADQRLNEALEEGPEKRPTGFGRLDVRVWATAIKRPALAGSPKQSAEPYGVAEFFRQCLEEASAYRQRGRRAGRRLRWAVRGMTLVALVLFALSFLLLTGLVKKRRSELEFRVERYRMKEGSTIGARLHDWPPDLERRRAELESIRRDSDFDTLPSNLQDFVDDRCKELDEYIPYLKDVLGARLSVIVRNDRELRERQEQLRNTLKLRHAEWKESGAGTLRQHRLDDLTLLKDRADRAEAWFGELRSKGLDLWLSRGREGQQDWRTWQDDAELFLRTTDAIPPALRDLPRHSLLTPSAILNFDRVRNARRTALATVQEVESLRDLSFALNLGHDDPLRPALLHLPPQVSRDDAAQRWERLRNHSPLLPSIAGLAAPSAPILRAAASFPPVHRWVSAYPNYITAFTGNRVSDSVRPIIEERVRTNRNYLIQSARDVIHARFREITKGQADTPAHWTQLAQWLAGNRAELEPYRRLAVVLGQLLPSPPADPVTELTQFLQKTEFQLTISGGTVIFPDRLRLPDLPERTQLVVKHGERTMTFPQDVEQRQRDTRKQTTKYVFKGDARDIAYKPGETLTVSLDLPDGRTLIWHDRRTHTFAFESIQYPPRLHPTNSTNSPEGSLHATGVELLLDRPSPPTPELLPDVRNKLRLRSVALSGS